MPLPPWISELTPQLLDTESLVLLEGTIDEQDVLVLARLDEVPGVRVELHMLAVILDAEMAEQVHVDPEKTTVYSLTTLEGDVDPPDSQLRT